MVFWLEKPMMVWQCLRFLCK